MITASVLNKAGVPASTVSLSKSTIHRQRQKQRQKSAQEIRHVFSSTKSAVHWDGKLLSDTDESTKSVLMAVLLTCCEDSSIELLGVPRFLSGTGKETADAVKGLLESWDIGIDTVGTCFDTTASNTGHYSWKICLNASSLAYLSAPHLRSTSIGRVYSVYGPVIWSRYSIIQTLSINMAEITPSIPSSNRCFAVSSDHDG